MAQTEIRNANTDSGRSETAADSIRGAPGIIRRLRRSILSGDYGYNDRLPAERELAALFNASRGTVRHALDQLESMNLVIRRPGSGTFVRYRDLSGEEQIEIAEITSPLELIDVRFAIEPQVARLAVLHARERDIARLDDALRRLFVVGSDANAFSSADEEFHLCLAEATRNPLLQWLYRQINDIRGHTQWAARKDKILSPARIDYYNTQHQAIYEAVRSRDVDSAVATIMTHLEQARGDLVGSSDRP
ncbi:MAG: FadR family transcriptional regulator [Gammaproteobacteria bacterium]|nr:FadR family transcriptional regulator [Gammaproteobacteria bacterium]MDH3466285.1 FadR family transcriptional regulator [Gammaproteobacteria bacterium]